ncbi:MAG: hypothetical protein QY332_12915 [Anaerolineales bacterium]|nr:MAG: hypothetical protein QY332_12915 [Anaerolineales bacterium]
MLAFRYLAGGGEIPNTALSWLMYAGIALFVLVIAVGWLTSPKESDQVETEHDAVKSKRKVRRKSG